jgi:hypothetical protein
MVLSKDGQEYANEEPDKASLTLLAVPIPRFLGAELCKRPKGLGCTNNGAGEVAIFFFCPRKPPYNRASLLGAPPFTDDLISGDFQAM